MIMLTQWNEDTACKGVYKLARSKTKLIRFYYPWLILQRSSVGAVGFWVDF